MMLAPTPPCRSGALAAIARAVLPLAIGPRAGERGCCRYSSFTTTVYSLWEGRPAPNFEPWNPHPFAPTRGSYIRATATGI